MKRVFLLILLTLASVLTLELLARYRQGYELFTASLTKINNFNTWDTRKMFNKSYVDENKDFFKNWPVPLETFDPIKKLGTISSRPAYLFKSNINEESPVKWSSNSQGLRGKEISPEKPSDTIRVVCLGASTTEGSQSDAETYPYYLEEELQSKTTKNVEVINAGHSGLNSHDLSVLFTNRIIPLKPDFVIYYETGNSINHLEPFELKGEINALHAVYNRSIIAQGIINRFHIVFPSQSYSYVEPDEYVSLDYYFVGVRQIISEAEKNDIQIILSTPVSGFHENLWTDSSVPDDLYWMYIYWYPIKPADAEKWYQWTGDRMKKLAKETDVVIVDTASKIPKDLKYYASYSGKTDPSHYSPAGNKLLAKIFAEYIESEIDQ